MSKDNPLVSIVIVNYNSGDLISNCVESLITTKNYDLEIILVDNASTDKSHLRCKNKFPQIKLIENQSNHGFCVANNIGISKAQGDYVVFLNPDTKVTSNWLNALFSAYKNFGDGMYQPKLLTLDQPEIINSAGNMMHMFGFGYSREKGEIDNHKFDHTEKIGFASGACLFTSMEIVKKINGFDDFLYVYLDDLDLGWKAFHLGFNSYYVPSSTVYHKGSYHYKRSPFKFYHLEKNRLYCLLTHYSKRTFYRILPSLILVEIMVVFFYLSKGMIKEKFRGYGTILKNRKFIKKKYDELEKKKLISDLELIKQLPDTLFVSNEISGNLTTKIFNSILEKLSRLNKFILGL